MGGGGGCCLSQGTGLFVVVVVVGGIGGGVLYISRNRLVCGSGSCWKGGWGWIFQNFFGGRRYFLSTSKYLISK